jgi:hypothetical protein
MGLAIGPLMNLLVWFMVFNVTFNIISVMSWSSFLLVEETGVPGENHRPVASHCLYDNLYLSIAFCIKI